MIDIIRHEPAMIRAVILAAVTLAISLGLRLTDIQVAHIDALVVAVLALLAGWSTRQRVTPYPIDPDLINRPGAVRRK